MNDDNRKLHNEDDVDLTGVINEYNQDNELRQKIEKMKREKEAEKLASSVNVNPLTNESYKSTIYDDEPAKKLADIKADEEAAKTRVGFEDDVNKTLVIMDGKKSMNAGEPQTTYTSYKEEDEIDEGDIEKTVVTPIEDYKDIHVLDDNDDSSEEDVDDNKNQKMNKTITYSIISIIVVALVVGIFFGGKYVYDSFFNSADTDTPTDVKDPTTEDKTPEEDEEEPKEKDDVTDNGPKIAALQKQKEAYEERLNTVNTNITSETTKRDAAVTSIKSMEKNEYPKILKAQKAADNYRSQVDLAESNYNEAVDRNASEEEKKTLKDILDAKNKEYNRLVSNGASLTNDYYEKLNPLKKDRDNANDNIKKYTEEKDKLTSQIADVKKQLQELEQ